MLKFYVYELPLKYACIKKIPDSWGEAKGVNRDLQLPLPQDGKIRVDSNQINCLLKAKESMIFGGDITGRISVPKTYFYNVQFY